MDENSDIRLKHQKIVLNWFWKLHKDITEGEQTSSEESSKKLKEDISVESSDRIQSGKLALQGRRKEHLEVLQHVEVDYQRGKTIGLDETSSIMEVGYLEHPR